MRWLVAVVTLPGTVVVLVPAVILWLSPRVGVDWTAARAPDARFWLALPVLAGGLLCGSWSMGLFARHGRGKRWASPG